MTSGDGNYKTFRIDKAKHPACAVSQNTYKVYKDEKGRPGDVEFMAQVILVDFDTYSMNQRDTLNFVTFFSKYIFHSYLYRSILDLDQTKIQVYWVLYPAMMDIWN